MHTVRCNWLAAQRCFVIHEAHMLMVHLQVAASFRCKIVLEAVGDPLGLQ